MNRQQRRAEERQRQKTDGIFHQCTRDNLANAAMRADQAGQPGAAELLRALMQGGLRLIFATDRTASVASSDLDIATEPTIAVIGDDDYRSCGPAGWRCAEAIAAWSRGAMIHAAGASAETYREAVRGAQIVGTLALVETDTAHAEAWARVFVGKPVLVVLPRSGARHPIQPAWSAQH